jgi:hypothetical protein
LQPYNQGISKAPQLPSRAVFHKVAQNLNRLESYRTYYALFKRAGKQIRRSLKTTDPALARQRLTFSAILDRVFKGKL